MDQKGRVGEMCSQLDDPTQYADRRMRVFYIDYRCAVDGMIETLTVEATSVADANRIAKERFFLREGTIGVGYRASEILVTREA